MFERFTDRARKVMAVAWQEAQRLNHPYIGTEHILLGLAKEDCGLGAAVIAKLSVDLGRIRAEVEKLIQPGPNALAVSKLPQTPGAKKAVWFAIEEAEGAQYGAVTSGHLLLGLLHEQDGMAATVLANLGVSLEIARTELQALLAKGTSEESTTGAGSSDHQAGFSVLYRSNWVVHLLTGFELQIERLVMAKNEALRDAKFETALELREKVKRAREAAGQVLREFDDLCRRAESVLEDLRKS